QIGDLFASCMDEAGVEARGARPLEPLLRRIDALASKKDLPELMAALHLATGDPGLLFDIDANQDFADSTRVITFVSAGGLSLPDRDYYLKTDPKKRETRDAFLAHVARMLQLLGSPAEAARR